MEGCNVPVVVAVMMVMVISGCQAWDCSVADRAVLLNFKNNFVDNAGVFGTWNITNGNCCAWEGVTCRESDGAVLELAIVGSSAANQQPYANGDDDVGASLVGLTHLQKLKIQWVLLNSGIPDEWGGFSSNLVAITINNANLREDIPSSLALVQSLQSLDLKNNHLTGSIPSSFCVHANINYIDVSYNDMNYILVPACLQGKNVTIISGNQGQSTSPGNAGAGSILTVASSLVLALASLSAAALFI